MKKDEELLKAQNTFEQEMKKFNNELQFLLNKFNLAQKPLITENGPVIRYYPVDNQSKIIDLKDWVKLIKIE